MTMADAVRLYEAGRWSEAASTLRQLLAGDPSSLAAVTLLAVVLGRQGEFSESLVLLERAAELDPLSPDTHNNIGNALAGLSRNDAAISAYERALELKPGFAEAENNLGNALLRLGRSEDAIPRYEKAIRLRPDYRQAHRNLARALRAAGQPRRAVSVLKQLIALQPLDAIAHVDMAEVALELSAFADAEHHAREAVARAPGASRPHRVLGEVLEQQGRLDDAIDSLREAVRLDPADLMAAEKLAALTGRDHGAIDYLLPGPPAVAQPTPAAPSSPGEPAPSAANYNLPSWFADAQDAAAAPKARVAFDEGLRLSQKDHHEAAATWFERAAQLDPRFTQAHHNLGTAFTKVQRFADAIPHFRKALSLRPNHAEAHHNMAVALTRLGEVDEALAAYGRALDIDPRYRVCLVNLALTYLEVERLDDAVATARRCLALYPDNADVHFTHALILLAMGDLEQGFAEYEHRWQLAAMNASRRNLASEPWQGQPLTGRSILLFTEQGFGDALQFLRYVPRVVAQGATVIVEVPRPVFRLVPSTAWGCQILVRGEDVPRTDYHCSIMSLPHLLGAEIETIPAVVPYLTVPAATCERWRSRIDAAVVNVGIVWAGQPKHRRDAERSVRIDTFAPLFAIPGIAWHSLQVGPNAKDVGTLAPGTITDWSAELVDFAETGGLMAQLDLVIAVDTSVVHLAGALGRPAWVLISRRPDWRWLLGRSDSPWYPGMRVFRQRKALEWTPVIGEVADALRNFLHSRERAR